MKQLTHGALTGTNLLGQRGPVSHCNEGVFHKLQDWSLPIRWSLLSYSGHSLGGFLLLHRGSVSAIWAELLFKYFLSWEWLCVNNDIEYQTIGLMSRVFANGPGGRGSISGRVIPKTQKKKKKKKKKKMILDATLLNTQHYKVRIKGKVE